MATIYLTKEQVLELCKPGEGAETCIWLVVGADGFECLYYNRHPALVDRWKAGLTVAKRDGCEKVGHLKEGLQRAEEVELIKGLFASDEEELVDADMDALERRIDAEKEAREAEEEA